MSALHLSPKDNNYLTSNLINQQITQNKMDLTLSSDVTEHPVNTTAVLTDGTGRVTLEGAVTITGTPAADMKIATLPTPLNPARDTYCLVPVLRSGTWVTNVIQVESSDNGISYLSMTNAGSYSGVPAISFGSPGEDAQAEAVMRIKTTGITSVTAQSGAGNYAPGDTITLAGGSAPGGFTRAVLNVTHTKVVSATVAAGGSGGTTGTQTVTGTTGTGTPFQASVTVAGGAITAVLSITVAGDYTVNPTTPTAEPVTGASLTGAQLNVKLGVLTATRNAGGIYGTVPSNPVAQFSTSGAGTGATFNVNWEVLGMFVLNSGHGYSNSTPVVFTGGGIISADPATATLNIDTSQGGDINLQNIPTADDLIFLDNITFLVEPYF